MTQRISGPDLIFFLSQRVDESKARMAEDLHALRAAVRRVLEAESAYASTDDRMAALRFNREICALRAEMASIDTPPNVV